MQKVEDINKHDPKKLVDEVLMERHLEEHYGVEPEGHYDKLVEYIKYLQKKARGD